MYRLLILLVLAAGCEGDKPAPPTSRPVFNEFSLDGILIQCTPPQVPRLIVKGDSTAPACIIP